MLEKDLKEKFNGKIDPKPIEMHLKRGKSSTPFLSRNNVKMKAKEQSATMPKNKVKDKEQSDKNSFTVVFNDKSTYRVSTLDANRKNNSTLK